MPASLKMLQLKKKIAQLETTYQSLLQDRADELSQYICALGLDDVDDKTLIGGLLFIKQKIMNADEIKEDWQAAGTRFLRSKRSRFNSKKSIASQKSHMPKTTDKQGKNLLQKETKRMQNQSKAHRQSRSRTLIQLRALLVKIGLTKDFDITLGDDLQHPKNLHKAACLLGFLKDKFEEENVLNSPQKHSWQIIGESLLIKSSFEA